MNIPPSLLEDVRHGRVILFLGAGASIGALDANGVSPPLGAELSVRIAQRFLGDSYDSQPLSWVAELAQSETDLVTVQRFIADQFANLQPASFHRALGNFRWRAIATVNYDRVIEESYLSNSDRVQDLVPIISDEDRVDDKLRSPDQLALLKLHGCVSVTERSDLPLILTTEQYITHQKGRKHLFRRLDDWATECPVVFVGHSLQDSNVRSMLLDLAERLETRPRYYLVAPGKDEIEKRLFSSKRISVLDGSFEDFIASLEKGIPQRQQRLLSLVSVKHPVEALFTVREEASTELKSFLETEAEFVHGGMKFGTGSAKAFYRGFDLGWYPVREGLDVRRGLTDKLLHDIIIRPESDRSTQTELYVIKAEAGAGKSVLLRRLAWEAATEAGVVAVMIRPYGHAEEAPLRELHRTTSQRVFLFWDHAAECATEMARFVRKMRRSEFPITVITTERPNTWNTKCEQLDPLLSGVYPLHYLSASEVAALVTLLENNDALGEHLASKTFEQRVELLEEQAGRQLLVALHEATLGDRFEDVIAREYENLGTKRAKLLYLTVCVLNRLRVPVRAGLISRVHGIPFSSFREELFYPLEKVVMVEERHATGDYHYRARHSEIAQIVFDRALCDSDDRYDEYIRILSHLNLSFDVDMQSFRRLLRAKSVHALFPSYEQANNLFARAQAIADSDPYIYQQRAIYERVRPNGNLVVAEEYLEMARKLSPRDTSIAHTFAEHYRSRGEHAQTVWERRKFRGKAESLIRELLSDPRSAKFASVTQVKLALDELRDVLEAPHSNPREIDQAIRQVERLLEKYLQRFPNETYLLTAEADFSALVRQHNRAFEALSQASKINPRDPYVATRLARAYVTKGKLGEAHKILEGAIKTNSGDAQLRFAYAEILRQSPDHGIAALAYEYERSFTPGDKNYEAQFWFARFAFESKEQRLRQKSRDVFQSLRRAAVSHIKRMEIRDTLSNEGRPTQFAGRMERMEPSYSRILRDGPSDLIFVHEDNVDEAVWTELQIGQRGSFEIGFNLTGATALNVAPC